MVTDAKLRAVRLRDMVFLVESARVRCEHPTAVRWLDRALEDLRAERLTPMNVRLNQWLAARPHDPRAPLVKMLREAGKYVTGRGSASLNAVFKHAEDAFGAQWAGNVRRLVDSATGDRPIEASFLLASMRAPVLLEKSGRLEGRLSCAGAAAYGLLSAAVGSAGSAEERDLALRAFTWVKGTMALALMEADRVERDVDALVQEAHDAWVTAARVEAAESGRPPPQPASPGMLRSCMGLPVPELPGAPEAPVDAPSAMQESADHATLPADTPDEFLPQEAGSAGGGAAAAAPSPPPPDALDADEERVPCAVCGVPMAVVHFDEDDRPCCAKCLEVA